MMSTDSQVSSFLPLWLPFALALAAARSAFCFSNALSLSISCSSLLLGRTVPGWVCVGLHYVSVAKVSGQDTLFETATVHVCMPLKPMTKIATASNKLIGTHV